MNLRTTPFSYWNQVECTVFVLWPKNYRIVKIRCYIQKKKKVIRCLPFQRCEERVHVFIYFYIYKKKIQRNRFSNESDIISICALLFSDNGKILICRFTWWVWPYKWMEMGKKYCLLIFCFFKQVKFSCTFFRNKNSTFFQNYQIKKI